MKLRTSGTVCAPSTTAQHCITTWARWIQYILSHRLIWGSNLIIISDIYVAPKIFRQSPNSCETLYEHTGRGIFGLTARPSSPSVTRDWLLSTSRHPPRRILRNVWDIFFEVAPKKERQKETLNAHTAVHERKLFLFFFFFASNRQN